MNHSTYTLVKDNQLVMETQAATLDRAIEYFAIDHPKIFSSESGYQVGIKQREKPEFEKLVKGVN